MCYSKIKFSPTSSYRLAISYGCLIHHHTVPESGCKGKHSEGETENKKTEKQWPTAIFNFF